jgi:hypothetical protein
LEPISVPTSRTLPVVSLLHWIGSAPCSQAIFMNIFLTAFAFAWRQQSSAILALVGHARQGLQGGWQRRGIVVERGLHDLEADSTLPRRVICSPAFRLGFRFCRLCLFLLLLTIEGAWRRIAGAALLFSRAHVRCPSTGQIFRERPTCAGRIGCHRPGWLMWWNVDCTASVMSEEMFNRWRTCDEKDHGSLFA